MRRTPLAIVTGALVLAACGTADDEGSPAAGTPPAAATNAPSEPSASTTDAPNTPNTPNTRIDTIPSSPVDVTVSGLRIWQSRDIPADAPSPLVDLEEIRSGGPPPDGIPPIDDPVFITIDEVDFLEDREPVLAFEIEGDARAYPVQIMTWHEIVNDTVGGLPVSVSYCPLCNSAVAYDRRVDDRVLDFGTSGLLWNSALVMYDRQTETLWSHFTGEGIVGELTGVRLEDFPLTTVAWSTWRDANPDGLVLSRDTGHRRDYGRNPYPGYDDVDGTPFLFEGEVDGRYTALTRIVGVERSGAALGVPLEDLRAARVVPANIAGDDIVIWWTSGTASALDDGAVAGGRDVGATGVFVTTAEGRSLTFTVADDETFTDDQTGSTWNVFGEAIAGELAGTELEAISHVDTFWFAWSTFRPDTVVVGS